MQSLPVFADTKVAVQTDPGAAKTPALFISQIQDTGNLNDLVPRRVKKSIVKSTQDFLKQGPLSEVEAGVKRESVEGPSKKRAVQTKSSVTRLKGNPFVEIGKKAAKGSTSFKQTGSGEVKWDFNLPSSKKAVSHLAIRWNNPKGQGLSDTASFKFQFRMNAGAICSQPGALPPA